MNKNDKNNIKEDINKKEENKDQINNQVERRKTDRRKADRRQEDKQKSIKSSKLLNQIKYKKRAYVVSFVILITMLVSYFIFRGNYLEIKELGENYLSIYWQNIRYMLFTFLINFSLIFTMVYLVNMQIKKGLVPFFEQENKQMPRFLNKSIAFIAAIIISAITSNLILEKVLLCFNSTQFGITDPNFGLDIGFYIFQKPFLELVLWYFIISVIVLLLYRVVYYIISFNIFLDGVDKKMLKGSRLVKEIANTIMILAILLAGIIFLEAQNIGNSKFITLNSDSSSYSLYGAGFVDSTIKVWGYRILALVVITSVFNAIKMYKKDKTKRMIAWMLVVPIYLVFLFLIMFGTQAIYVDANEYDKEKQYISSNIKATKSAYGIEVEETSLDDYENINIKTVKEYSKVLENIAIVDSNIVLKDLNNGQTAKGYYSYRTSQIGKYNINGKNELVYISPREIINSTGTYNSKTYENTHGYGAIITSATSTTENGNVYNVQKDFENSENDIIPITEPRIYYGLETNDTVVTKITSNKEFDYPLLDSSNAENEQTEYDGKSGLKLNFLDRLIIAIKEGDIKLAFSSNLTKDSKILINRNIIKRAKTLMPFLKYDEKPYMVVSDEGKLIWVLDAYTISNEYPYSQKTTLQETQTSKLQLNYIRNSVKVLIDSYDGTIKFYITDRTDPIAMAYYNIYQDLFVNIDEKIPEDISAHFIYPEYLYSVQANIISRYHNVQPDVLYRGDDIWNIATYNSGKVLTKTGSQITPYYTTIKTIDNDKDDLALILPYTIYGKQNLIAYTVGTCDNEGNTKLKIYKYSANSNILGPMQLDTKLVEDETIAKELEALNVSGTKITKNIIVVPLNNTLLYVEPIFTQYLNEKNSLPTLKKVVVASGTKVAIGNTLNDAISNLVSKYAVDLQIENTDTIDDLLQTLIKANKNLSTSNESNDWEMMGKDVKKIQDLIDKLEVLVQQENDKKAQEELENKSKEKSNNIINDN